MRCELDYSISTCANDSLYAELVKRWPHVVPILILADTAREQLVRVDSFEEGRRRLARLLLVVERVALPLLRILMADERLVVGLLVLA